MTGETGRIRLDALTTGRSALFAAVVAVGCFAGALGNEWAIDDEYIVEANPAVHAVDQAMDSFFEPYWPEASGIPAGQYRPLVILWYSLDWLASGGRAWWFHAVNVLVHGVATALLVLVVGRWLAPLGALVAGVVFAVHPVHVEAVANVVGRAEVATATLLLAGILTARRYRASVGPAGIGWLCATLIFLTCALFIKEHAVVFIALLAVDEYLERPRGLGLRHLNLYLGVITVTIAWLYLWSGIAQGFVASSATAALRDTSHGARLATMFPAYFDVTRLLVWPFELSPDYNPQMIPRRLGWSLISIGALVFTGAIVLLGWKLRDKEPGIAAAIFGSIIVYAPTSNLLFASGVLLAERNLYLSVWAPAVALGWLVCRLRYSRWILAGNVAVTLLIASYAFRTVQRVPEWENTEQILTGGFAEHPENYRGHLRVATLFLTAGDSARALAQALAGGAIFPMDPFANEVTVPLATSLGYHELAVRESERSLEIGSDYPAVIRMAVLARISAGHGDTALSVARMGVERHPSSPMVADTYLEILDTLGSPSWVQDFARARSLWILSEPARATVALNRGLQALSPADLVQWCWDLNQTGELLESLLPTSDSERRELLLGFGSTCEREVR